MRIILLLAALAPAAAAGVVQTPGRAAPSALAGPASLGAPAVSFDGFGPLKPWVELPGSPLVQVGSSLIDTRVFGSMALLKSLTFADDRPVLGIFELRTARVLNAFAAGTSDVRGHSDALPQGQDRRELGGYTVFMRPDGSTLFYGSGALPADITPAVQRSVLRHLGVRPAVLTWRARLKRAWLRALDWALSLGLS